MIIACPPQLANTPKNSKISNQAWKNHVNKVINGFYGQKFLKHFDCNFIRRELVRKLFVKLPKDEFFLLRSSNNGTYLSLGFVVLHEAKLKIYWPGTFWRWKSWKRGSFWTTLWSCNLSQCSQLVQQKELSASFSWRLFAECGVITGDTDEYWYSANNLWISFKKTKRTALFCILCSMYVV